MFDTKSEVRGHPNDKLLSRTPEWTAAEPRDPGPLVLAVAGAGARVGHCVSGRCQRRNSHAAETAELRVPEREHVFPQLLCLAAKRLVLREHMTSLIRIQQVHLTWVVFPAVFFGELGRCERELLAAVGFGDVTQITLAASG